MTTIEFRGSYRYPSPAELDRALAAARTRIADDDHADIEPDWTHAFQRLGATLRIDVALPHAADRYLAAAVLESLASTAIEGIVEARRGGLTLDWWASSGGLGGL